MSDLSLNGGIRLPQASQGDRKTQVGSSQHFTGGLVLGDGPGKRLGLESHLEANAALLLGYRPETSDLTEQVRFEWFDEHGELRNHFIDLVQLRKNAVRIGYAVRPTGRVSHRYLRKLARIKEQAVAKGALEDLRLFTEEDVCPVELFNARLFHSVRRPDCFGDPVAHDVVRAMSGVVRLGDLVDQTGLAGMGFRALVRLIRSGHLKMPRFEQITHESRLFKATEV